MSEKLRHSPEHKAEAVEKTSVESKQNLERIHEAAKLAEQDPLQKHVESLAKSAEAKAKSSKELHNDDKHGESAPLHFGVQKQLKSDSYKRTMSKIQHQLPLPQRALSKVIHQPVIEAVSAGAAKTVARPSGFLFGSIVAFLGSAAFLYMAKHYGFTYNYAVLFILFVGGFALGLLLEAVYRLFRRRSA